MTWSLFYNLFNWVADPVKYSTILLFVIFSLVGCEQPSEKNNWILSVTDRIQSDYGQLALESEILVSSLQQYCNTDQDKKQSALNKAQNQWRSAMAAWQQIQWVRFGPISENNDDWKIQFWPDKKNLVARKTQQFLVENEEVTQKKIAEASVVIQGISELELLLFDPNYISQCQLLQAVGENLSLTTKQIHQAWIESHDEKWVQSIHQPEQKAEMEGQLFGALLAQMERIKLDKLGGPLGLKNRNKKPNGYFSESWRSNHSLANIETNINAFQGVLVDPKRYDLVELLLSLSQKELANRLLDKVSQIQDAIAAIQKPLNKAVHQESTKQQVAHLYGQIGDLNSLLKNDVAKVLNITLGFNANDGD